MVSRISESESIHELSFFRKIATLDDALTSDLRFLFRYLT